MTARGTATARDEVLARIAAALADTAPADTAPADSAPGNADDGVPRTYRASTDRTGLLDLLAERLADYGCRVLRTAPAHTGAVVGEALRQRGATRIGVPPGPELASLAGLASLPTGIEVIADNGLSPADLDALDGVITGAAVAIAETGTIVLDGSPGQGRRALTLVPDYHLCIVRSGQVVGLVPEAVARLTPDRPLTWISGPSATSDIELDRVQGVHGPRTLDVILVDG